MAVDLLLMMFFFFFLSPMFCSFQEEPSVTFKNSSSGVGIDVDTHMSWSRRGHSNLTWKEETLESTPSGSNNQQLKLFALAAWTW